MKQLTRIFHALLGVGVLICAAPIAVGRLTWRTLRSCWMGCAKWLRRSIAAILIIVPIGFVALGLYIMYDEEYGRSYYNEWLSDDVVVHSFADGTWRVYNRSTGEYTTDKVDWVSEGSEDAPLAVYATCDKRGYIDTDTGCVVIDAKANDYRKAWLFSEGVAAVVRGDKIGFINRDNEVVIPFEFNYCDRYEAWDMGYLFHGGYCIMTNAEGDFGLIDCSGNWVVEPEYDEIWAQHESGYRVVVDNGRYGLLNADGTVRYPAEYGNIDILADGFVLTKDGRMWQVDAAGRTIHAFMYDSSYELSYLLSYSDTGEERYWLSDYAAYEVMGCYGIMERYSGEPITAAIYESVEMLSRRLFEVRLPHSNTCILLDEHGREVAR